MTGYTDECEVEFTYHNQVRRVREDPRVTKPYSEAQWQAIDALGDAVDADLAAGDVRLTMGGEPTFVSIDDMEGAEWNTAALGPTKRAMAGRAAARAAAALRAAGGVLHYGQGKWYPGEAAAALGAVCFWRDDGVPLWHDRRCSPTRRDAAASGSSRPRASSARSPSGSAWRPIWSCPATRTSSTTCGRKARCRPTSIRCSPTSATRRSAGASPRCCAAASAP